MTTIYSFLLAVIYACISVMKVQHITIEMVITTGSPGDFIDWGGREGRLHSNMCDSVHRLCVWETGIVWHLLCNDHDLFLFCVYLYQWISLLCECVWAGVTCESWRGTSLLRRKVSEDQRPSSNLDLRPYTEFQPHDLSLLGTILRLLSLYVSVTDVLLSVTA